MPSGERIFSKTKSLGVKVDLDSSNYTTKATLKTQQVLIHYDLLKKLIQQAEEVDKLDIDQLEKVPTGLKSLKSKVCKLHVDKLVLLPVDFK